MAIGQPYLELWPCTLFRYKFLAYSDKLSHMVGHAYHEKKTNFPMELGISKNCFEIVKTRASSTFNNVKYNVILKKIPHLPHI